MAAAEDHAVRPPKPLGAAGMELGLAVVAALAVSAICLGGGLWAASLDPKATPISAAGDVAKLLTLALGVPAVILALFNHQRSVAQQREAVAQQARTDLWKRREFVLKAVTEFEASPQVKFAMALLDYNGRDLTLPGAAVPRYFAEFDLLSALAPRDSRGSYQTTDTAIRDCFDTFFNGLDRLGVMCDAGLISWEDLAPYVSYWLELLEPGPRERDAAFGPIIRQYLAWFHYDSLQRLMVRLDLDADYDEAVDLPVIIQFIDKLSALPPANSAERAPPRAARSKAGARASRSRTPKSARIRTARSRLRGMGPEEEEPELEEED